MAGWRGCMCGGVKVVEARVEARVAAKGEVARAVVRAAETVVAG